VSFLAIQGAAESIAAGRGIRRRAILG